MTRSERFEGVIPTWAVPEAGDHVRIKVTFLGNGRPVLTIEYRPGYHTTWSVPFAVPYIVTDHLPDNSLAERALSEMEDEAVKERRKVHTAWLKWVHPNHDHS